MPVSTTASPVVRLKRSPIITECPLRVGLCMCSESCLIKNYSPEVCLYEGKQWKKGLQTIAGGTCSLFGAPLTEQSSNMLYCHALFKRNPKNVASPRDSEGCQQGQWTCWERRRADKEEKSRCRAEPALSQQWLSHSFLPVSGLCQ